MTEIELLKAQVEALEKLVKIKDGTIFELEKQVASKPTVTTQYVYHWPYNPYNYHVIPSQWQQQPYYGAGGGAGGVSTSGLITFGNSVAADGVAQTAGYANSR